jgi:hypothetical protein
MLVKKTGYYTGIIICVVLFNICCIKNLPAQENIELEEINLMDTLEYVSFNVKEVCNKKYPPENLFDGNMNTCWVAGSANKPKNSSLFLKLPDTGNPILNIFPGYGKSKTLYKQNARPKEIKLTVYPAYSWGGFAFNYGMSYLAAKFPFEITLHIPDTFETRSIPINFPEKMLQQFKKKVQKKYRTSNEFPLEISTLILKVEILETYPGNKYDDICISEIFLNDRFVPNRPISFPKIKKVYENAEQNAILLDDSEKNAQMVFKDTSKIIQLLEVSPDKKWAIILTMPNEIEGRAETIYHLLDLVNRKEITQQVESITGDQINLGMTFKTGKYGKLFLDYYEGKIELK